MHLQVNDLIEPWEVSQKFGEIVRQVEDISRNLGEVLSSHQPIRELKTDDFLKLLPHRPHENQPPALPTPSLSVESEDFVDYGCRALLNEQLVYAFLGSQVFHPILKPEENRIISRTYEKIRKQGKLIYLMLHSEIDHHSIRVSSHCRTVASFNLSVSRQGYLQL